MTHDEYLSALAGIDRRQREKIVEAVRQASVEEAELLRHWYLTNSSSPTMTLDGEYKVMPEGNISKPKERIERCLEILKKEMDG